MNFLKGTLAVALTGLLTACGGGGSKGYYGDTPPTGGTVTPPPQSNTSTELATKQLETLKREGQFLFGNYDSNDFDTAKGYIDHSLDTFAHGPLQLTLAIREVDFSNFSNFYRAKCFDKSTSDYRACYSFTGDEIKQLLPSYADWDFEITSDDLKNIRLEDDNISPNLEAYQATTRIFVFENENEDKNLHDVTITGAFAYPFKQKWVNQIDQKRFVLINETTSDYKITVTTTTNDPVTNLPVEKEVTTGAFSTYKDLTSLDGELFMFEKGSGFNVLINDNTNVSFAEPISFIINSKSGDLSSSSSYRIKSSGEKELKLVNITTIDGTRVENETPNRNTQSFTGNISLTGQNIFTFKNETSGTLSFEHLINGIKLKGTSTNNNGTITTTLTEPTGLKF
ncbi:hypothetical protein J4G46_12080 [Acinetobacter towneri]|uniref:hypothetical protein n=1 Tax=Acinetobacter towneri TaxID=202956 RepID=UPI001AA08812|nr:hypothetical protein [Acinetobacter towneri]QTD64000.1 hypothetical protein J4G46_12080 [Acinetobacter towneri]